MAGRNVSVIARRVNASYTFSNHITDQRTQRGIPWWQPYDFAMRRVSLIIFIGSQRLAYKTNANELIADILFSPVNVKFGESSIPASV